MDELEGHPEGWNSRGDGDAFGDVAAADYIPSYLPWRQPPYGSRLKNRFISGWRPSNKTVFIAVGSDAWRVARRWDSEPGRRAVLCLPPDADPSRFDWGIVAGFDCIVFAAGDVTEGVLDRLAAHLLRAGAGGVVACGDRIRMITYRRSSHEGQSY